MGNLSVSYLERHEMMNEPRAKTMAMNPQCQPIGRARESQETLRLGWMVG